MDNHDRYRLIDEIVHDLTRGDISHEEADARLKAAYPASPVEISGQARSMWGAHIRVEIESVREAIVNRMALREDVMRERLDEGLKKAINAFDFDGVIFSLAQSEIEKAVKGAIQSAGYRLARDPKMIAVIQKKLITALTEDLVGEE